jgi:hypothetical protein
MAMTEMSGPEVDSASADESTAAMTPPAKSSGEQNDGTPDSTHAEGEFETPQKNLLGKFMSPKRKASETETAEVDTPSASAEESLWKKKTNQQSPSDMENDDSPKREHPEYGTPAIEQKVKRTRLGSLRKGAPFPQGGSPNLATDNNASAMELATPAKVAGCSTTADLTPVSARCIDFKKMRVNDSTTDPAVVDQNKR